MLKLAKAFRPVELIWENMHAAAQRSARAHPNLDPAFVFRSRFLRQLCGKVAI